MTILPVKPRRCLLMIYLPSLEQVLQLGLRYALPNLYLISEKFKHTKRESIRVPFLFLNLSGLFTYLTM